MNYDSLYSAILKTIPGLLLDPKWKWWCSSHGTNPATRNRSVLVTSPLTHRERTCPVLPMLLDLVNKPNSHEREQREEWLSLDSVTDIPPDCLVDSLDDAGSGIVLLHFLEASRLPWNYCEDHHPYSPVMETGGKHRLTARSASCLKTWTIWALF